MPATPKSELSESGMGRECNPQKKERTIAEEDAGTDSASFAAIKEIDRWFR